MHDFDRMPPIAGAKELMDIAFSRGKKLVAKSGKDALDSAQRDGIARIDMIKDILCERLQENIKLFPSFERLPPYYIHLTRLTLDVGEVKHSLGAMAWASQQIKKLSATHMSMIQKTKSVRKVGELRRAYYGRVSSVLKAVRGELETLEAARRVMRDYPVIQEGFTICIVGFPNVGKSTLLKKLSGAHPQIDSYAFTTKTLNLGYIKEPPIQLIDTPGALNRPEKMNPVEIQADLAMRYLADAFISVIDLSEPYPLAKQLALHKKVLELKKPTVVFLSKADILEKEMVKNIDVKEKVFYDVGKLALEMTKIAGQSKDEQKI